MKQLISDHRWRGEDPAWTWRALEGCSRQKESEEGRACLTALTTFASPDSSITVPSVAEGTTSCSTSLMVIAILFYQLFFGWKRSTRCPGGC